MADDAIARREFLKGASVAGAAAATALGGRSETAQAQVPAQATGAATDAAGIDAYLTLGASPTVKKVITLLSEHVEV